jgi:hypothetical protein
MQFHNELGHVSLIKQEGPYFPYRVTLSVSIPCPPEKLAVYCCYDAGRIICLTDDLTHAESEYAKASTALFLSSHVD